VGRSRSDLAGACSRCAVFGLAGGGTPPARGKKEKFFLGLNGFSRGIRDVNVL
jgi:hypothetical protein